MKDKFKPDAQTLVSFSLMGPESGGPCLVDSSGGRITRIRPYFYDTAYTEANCNPWRMEARGSSFRAPDRVTITPFGLGYRTRVYSRNRVMWPLKRVDWDPKGERNPQNRGVSRYVRISWDEAAQIAADELRRILGGVRIVPIRHDIAVRIDFTKHPPDDIALALHALLAHHRARAGSDLSRAVR